MLHVMHTCGSKSAEREEEMKERNEEIVRLRKEGMYLDAIGKKFGIGTTRVRQILARAERIKQKEEEHPNSFFYQLDVRSMNGLCNYFGYEPSRKEIEEVIGNPELLLTKNLGERSIKRIALTLQTLGEEWI